MRIRGLGLAVVMTATIVPVSSCKNPPQEKQCFYQLEVPSDVFQKVGADAISRISDRLFDEYFGNGWPPPLAWNNVLHFAEVCDLKSETGTYILTELDGLDYSYSLREITEADYKLVYNSR